MTVRVKRLKEMEVQKVISLYFSWYPKSQITLKKAVRLKGSVSRASSPKYPEVTTLLVRLQQLTQVDGGLPQKFAYHWNYQLSSRKKADWLLQWAMLPGLEFMITTGLPDHYEHTHVAGTCFLRWPSQLMRFGHSHRLQASWYALAAQLRRFGSAFWPRNTVDSARAESCLHQGQGVDLADGSQSG